MASHAGDAMRINLLTNAAEVEKGIMAYGVVGKVRPEIFLTTLAKIEAPLVVMSFNKNLFSELFQYLTNYKGLFFYIESKLSLEIPKTGEMVEVERMRISSM